MSIPPSAPDGVNDVRAQSREPDGNIKSVQAEHVAKPKIVRSEIARSFLRLTTLDNGIFERLGRYELSLWRQTVQIILLLNSINSDPNDRHAECDDKYLNLRNASRKRRRFLWPPLERFPFKWTIS